MEAHQLRQRLFAGISQQSAATDKINVDPAAGPALWQIRMGMSQDSLACTHAYLGGLGRACAEDVYFDCIGLHGMEALRNLASDPIQTDLHLFCVKYQVAQMA